MRSNQLSFFDVLAFAAGYWRQQRWRLAVILAMFVAAALLETYLPTALSNFLATIRLGQGKAAILSALAVFLGVYFVQMVLFGVSFIVYNVFETTIFKSLLDDAFAHVQRLSEHFFVNTFTGAIVSKISRARQKIEILRRSDTYPHRSDDRGAGGQHGLSGPALSGACGR